MGDRGTLDGATTETTANLTTEAGTSSGQTVVEPLGADNSRRSNHSRGHGCFRIGQDDDRKGAR